jgi:hypothetical protein
MSSTMTILQLSRTLSDLEDQHGFSSAFAMFKIRQGKLVHPAWERLYAEYRKRVAWHPPEPPKRPDAPAAAEGVGL